VSIKSEGRTSPSAGHPVAPALNPAPGQTLSVAWQTPVCPSDVWHGISESEFARAEETELMQH